MQYNLLHGPEIIAEAVYSIFSISKIYNKLKE